jgi:hypothetical protein
MTKAETPERPPDSTSSMASPPESPATPDSTVIADPQIEPETVRFRFAPDDRAAEPDQQAEAPPPPLPPEDDPSDGFEWASSGPSIALVAGSVVASVAVVFLILWIAGPFRDRDEAAMAVNARLAQMESQLRDLAARPAPASFDPKPLEELSARLARIESTLSTRLAAAEIATKSTADNLAALNRRIDETTALARDARGQADAAATAASRNPEAARADLEALGDRLAAVERNAKAADAELAKRVAAVGDDRAGRLAIAAVSLRATVERGDPFANELAAVKALAPNANALASLEPYATSGLPPPVALAREWGKLAPLMQRAAGSPPADGGFIEKLQQNAERLVRIRPIADAPGDDPATVIGRIESKTAQNDVAGALAELRKLPPQVRAPAEDWARRAEGRNAALETIKQFTATALAALGKTGS